MKRDLKLNMNAIKNKLLLFIAIFAFGITNVKAMDLGNPQYDMTYDSYGETAVTELGTWGDTPVYYTNNWYIVRNGSILKSTYFKFVNANLCVGNDITISGRIYGSQNGSNNLNVGLMSSVNDIKVYGNNQLMSCVFSDFSEYEKTFTCTGKGGGDLKIMFSAPDNYSLIYGSFVHFAIRRSFDVSCDLSNGGLANSVSGAIDNSTNTIINNQEQNTNRIEDAVSGLGSSIVENNNQNKNDIVNNQEQNKNEIIENQNQNNEELKDTINDNFNSCKEPENLFDGTFNQGTINSNGNFQNSTNQIYTSQFIKVEPNTTYIYSNAQNIPINNIVLYDNNKNFIERVGINSFSYTTNSNTYYIKFTHYNATGITPNNITNAIFKQDIEFVCTNKMDETNNRLEDILNSDMNDRDKELPDDSSYQDYSSSEKDLLDKTKDIDLNILDIGIDVSSSKWIWETLTSLIQSHSSVFGMFISILSIGIIKLALGR